jgi:NitT/TauT family transport system permease protein
MFDSFRPNKSITGTAWTVIIVAQIVLLLIIWSFGSAYMVPSPIEIGRAWLSLVQTQGLLYELGISISTNLEAIFISTILSIGLSYLTVLPVMQPIVKALSKSRFLGLTGFVIIFTMIFGGGRGLKIALLVFGMSVFFITSMASVVENIPREDFDHARSLRMSPWRIVYEVVILGKADEAFEVLRQNSAMGWVMLSMVEGLVRSDGGAGTLMLNEGKHFHLDAVFAIQLSILTVGIVQDQIIGAIKNLFCPYSRLILERK